MTGSEKPPIGTINWTDLTVPDAEAVREFYSGVVGWTSDPCDMGGYSDYNMNSPESGNCVAGICHARGPNADQPAQWMIYITVSDLDSSMDNCVKLGGKVVAGPKNMGGAGRYCVVQDPAGAVAGLWENA